MGRRRPPAGDPGYSSKPQPTLKGFFAWAFDELVRQDGKKPGPVAAAMIEAHLRGRLAELAEEYKITRERFEQETGQNVVRLPREGA